MIGLPFLFIPINTVAYVGLPANKTNQGSALMNVARNLGGSMGISIANVVLTQRTQFHQSRLVENTVPSSPAFQSTLQHITQYFTAHGASPGDAQQPGDGLDRPDHPEPGDHLGVYRCFPRLLHRRGHDDSLGPHHCQARAYPGAGRRRRTLSRRTLN